MRKVLITYNGKMICFHNQNKLEDHIESNDQIARPRKKNISCDSDVVAELTKTVKKPNTTYSDEKARQTRFYS